GTFARHPKTQTIQLLRSFQRSGGANVPSQRCLLSRASTCLISSDARSISARITPLSVATDHIEQVVTGLNGLRRSDFCIAGRSRAKGVSGNTVEPCDEPADKKRPARAGCPRAAKSRPIRQNKRAKRAGAGARSVAP